jgi:signal transduction histidine kinase
MENEIIQSIRLGAADYLLMPARETEILTVVEQAVKKVREDRERERASRQLRSENQELQSQLEEAARLLELGKELTSVTDATLLPGKIVDRFCQMFQADIGWLLLKEETSKAFLLAAQRNLPASMPVQLNQPWDDGISPLVAVSGEPLEIHGERFKRYKVASLGEAALVLPLKISGKPSGLLALVRVKDQPFNPGELRLALSAADFAAIALANVRLIRSISERSRQQEQITAAALTSERITNELLQRTRREMQALLEVQDAAFHNITENLSRQLSQYQRDQFDQLEDSLTGLLRLAEVISPPKTSRALRHSRPINLNETIRNTAARFEPFTRSNEISLTAELPDHLVFIHVDEEWLSQVLDGLVSNAVKFCVPGGSVTLRIEPAGDDLAHVTVTDSGPPIEPEMLGKLFTGTHSTQVLPQRLGGLGISLPLIKDIITRMDGKIWAENKPGLGVQFHLVLPVQ